MILMISGLDYPALLSTTLMISGLDLIFRLSRITIISKVLGTTCHLFYTDDILLFLKGQKKSLLALKEVLQNYQRGSGQTINLLKSKLFIGKCNLRLKRTNHGVDRS